MDKWTWKDKLLLATLPPFGSLILRLLSRTMRKKVLYPERPQQFWRQSQNIIGAFWHQRLLMMPFLPRVGKVGIMISQHRDGEIGARTCKFFGIDVVRGSTSRGSLSALRGMLRFYRKGGNLVITPDGPGGPKHIVQIGTIQLARQTGALILPVTYGASLKKILNSWDHFIVPIPFCRIVYIWGEPLFVPRDSGREEMEEKRLLLQDRLRQVSEEADLFFKKAK